MAKPKHNSASNIKQMLAAALLPLFVLAISGCSLIPGDVINTLPGLTSEITASTSEAPVVSSPLLITEIMSTNQSTLQIADLVTTDWIEIFNSGDSAINLQGYFLSDKLKDPKAWVFPSVTIQPGKYLVIYASGLEATDQSDAAGEIHANFRLNGDGDELVLTSPTGQALARLAIPALPADISYGMLDTADSAESPYYYFGEPTPGAANGMDGKETAAAAIPEIKYDLVINEYMTDNQSMTDNDGDLPDWIELLNTGSTPVSLLGFTLSDNPDDSQKWEFPDVTMNPGEFLVVWLSGKETTYDPAQPQTLQAPFKLGKDDTELIMADVKGNLVIRQTIKDLPPNVSLGRKNGELATWLYYPRATPGDFNTTAGFAEISGAISLKNRGIWINEVLAQDSQMTSDGKVKNPDWIELYNGTSETVSLEGFGLSDSKQEPYLMTLTGLRIEPGQYLVVEPEGFGLNILDETIYLTSPDQGLADWFRTGALGNGISSGRGNSDGDDPADTRYFYTSPTRGQPNNTSKGYQAVAMAPEISVTQVSGSQVFTGLYISEPVQVELSSRQSGAVIRYTLDGSQPGASSAIYESPLTISKNTVICCRAEMPESLPSAVMTRTLLADEPHDLPIVSIAIKPDHLTGASQGLWTNYTQDLEHPAEISYYETDGTHGVYFTAGIALHGSFSRKETQKSLELNLRELYGDGQVIYPFFPDNKVSTYKRLILRTSGQDWKYTKLRDAFMSEVVEDDLNIDTMDWRPCVLYVNGEYYGLYEIRENIDEYYMAAHYGTDPDNVDIIKGNGIMLSGTRDKWQELQDYVKAHDLQNDLEAYQYVLSQIDESSLMDWLIAQTFFNNLDSGNKKFWRQNTEGSQWHWAFFDLDWAMFPSTYTKNILKNDLLDPNGHGQQNLFSSRLQVKLMENPEFREAFIERYAWCINNTFATERMLGILDNMTAVISSEMPLQIARWGKPSSVSAWENNVATLRRITSEKRARVQIILQETFNLSASRMHELFPEDY